jgi:hypothetical protein
MIMVRAIARTAPKMSKIHTRSVFPKFVRKESLMMMMDKRRPTTNPRYIPLATTMVNMTEARADTKEEAIDAVKARVKLAFSTLEIFDAIHMSRPLMMTMKTKMKMMSIPNPAKRDIRRLLS